MILQKTHPHRNVIFRDGRYTDQPGVSLNGCPSDTLPERFVLRLCPCFGPLKSLVRELLPIEFHLDVCSATRNHVGFSARSVW